MMMRWNEWTNRTCKFETSTSPPTSHRLVLSSKTSQSTNQPKKTMIIQFTLMKNRNLYPMDQMMMMLPFLLGHFFVEWCQKNEYFGEIWDFFWWMDGWWNIGKKLWWNLNNILDCHEQSSHSHASSVEDDEDGHLIYRNHDVLLTRCSWLT